MGINLAVSAGVAVDDLILTGNRAIARSGSVDWVDPVVGARLRHRLAPGHELMVRGDVGGFDAGSQFSWNAIAAYSWDFAVRSGVTYSGGVRVSGALRGLRTGIRTEQVCLRCAGTWADPRAEHRILARRHRGHLQCTIPSPHITQSGHQGQTISCVGFKLCNCYRLARASRPPGN